MESEGIEEGSVCSLTPSQKIKQMEAGITKSTDSSFWGDPAKTSISKPHQSRDTVGTCLIVFALPLLIPGVTLTAVAFEDETGFSKYSVLHVLGMVMLVWAGIFIMVGVALLVRIGYKVVPELQDGPSTTASTQDSNIRQSQAVLSYNESVVEKSYKDIKSDSSVTAMPALIPTIATTACSSSTDPTITPGAINTTAPPVVPMPPSKIPLNFMIETGQGHNPDQQNMPTKVSTVGSLLPITAIQSDLSHRLSIYSDQGYSKDGLDGYVSSSYDEYSDDLDSDENSSGSYIVTGENGAFQYSDEEEPYRQTSLPRTRDISKEGPSKTSITPRSGLTLNIPPSRNFFFDDSVTHNTESLPEITKVNRINKVSPLKQQDNILTGEAVQTMTPISNPKNTLPETHIEDFGRQTSTKNPTPKMVPSPMGSPRQRLEAISHVSALASTVQIKHNEELHLQNIVGEMSESNGSVFTSGEEAEPVLEEDTKDTKRLSADDVICREKFTPSPKRAFSFDVTTEDETQTSAITNASGSLADSGQSKSEDITSSPTPKLVSILRSTSAYDSFSPDKQQTNDDEERSQSSSQPSGNRVSSAIFSSSTTIFNFMNISSNDSSGSGNAVSGRGYTNPVVHQGITSQLEPVPLKSKKRATFKSKEGGDLCQVLYFD